MDRICSVICFIEKKDDFAQYTIYETDKIEGKEGYLGYADYDNKAIVIEKTLEQQKRIETLIHELMHVWLEENGYDQSKLFNVEKVCDVVAYAIPFISIGVRKYCKAKGFVNFYF